MLPFAVEIDKLEIDQFDPFLFNTTKNVLGGRGHLKDPW